MKFILRVAIYSAIVLLVFLLLGFHQVSNLPTVILSSIIFGILINLYRAFIKNLQKKAEKHRSK